MSRRHCLHDGEMMDAFFGSRVVRYNSGGFTMSPPVGCFYCRWWFLFSFLFSTTGEMIKFEKQNFQIWVGW